MDDVGIFVKGYLVGMDSKEEEFDGKRKVKYQYLVAAGINPFLVTSYENFGDRIAFQDLVKFAVTPRVFNGRIFYGGARLLEN